MTSRRQFLKLAGTGVLAAGASSLHAIPVMPVSADKTINYFQYWYGRIYFHAIHRRKDH